jgi:hypothetical protein
MKTRFTMILSVAMFVTFAGLANAQTSPQTTPAEKDKQQPRATQPKEGERAGQPNWGTLMSSINNSSTEVTELQGLKNLTATNVQVVNVSDLAKGNNMEALHNALQRHDADITKLRTAVGANTVITQQLKSKNIAANRVVAIDVDPTGTVYVFVQPSTM